MNDIYRKEIRISDEEMCAAFSPDTALAHAIAKAGIELPPMPWLPISADLGNEQRMEKWNAVFAIADIEGIESMYRDADKRETVYILKLKQRIIS